MKLFFQDVLGGIFMGLLLPGIMLNFAALLLNQPGTLEETPVEISAEPLKQEVSQEEARPLRMDFLKSDGNMEAADMDDYLVGVVLAEMPVWFSEEALKAQAVASRTYTMKAVLTGGKHGDGSLCGFSGCCQGYVTDEDYLLKGGTRESLEKVRHAVVETRTQVLVYDGELIEAVYFSSSGGKTESALAVWGADYPYLQSVESPGEEAAAYVGREMFIPISEFQSLLDIQLDNEPETWFSDAMHTEGGGIERVRIGGKEFTGIQLRGLLSLPSTAFSITTDGETVMIVTSGYGHRVGLSQYGANSMAKNGSGFRDILAHFYPGTTLASIE